MKIIGVNERFNHAVGADFSDSLVCSKNNTTAVFVYAASILFLSVPAWNELSLDTQADLFVNEGDRHIQKLLGVPLTNREVQTLTWSILQNPNTTQKDLSFINTRLAEYKGVAKFQEAFCQYAVEFGQNPTFPRVLVQEISKICENPLLALDESPILRAELSKISEDFSLSDEVLKRARDLSEFVAQVKLTAAAKAFANNSNMIGSKMIHLAIELGSRTLLQCQNEYSPEKCQNTINSFQDILNAGMIW